MEIGIRTKRGGNQNHMRRENEKITCGGERCVNYELLVVIRRREERAITGGTYGKRKGEDVKNMKT